MAIDAPVALPIAPSGQTILTRLKAYSLGQYLP